MAHAQTTKCTARLEIVNGIPRLIIHGQQVEPLIFFFNTEMPLGQEYLEPQVKLAVDAGIHLYSMVLPWPWLHHGVEPDFAAGEAILNRFLAIDPDAYFIPRLHNDAAHLYPHLARERPEECIHYADGSIAEMESMASAWWQETLERGLRRTFRHYEQSPFAERIIGYIFGSEWFHHGFWDQGWDFNPQNGALFQKWLAEKYESPGALQVAWSNAQVTFETAQIPRLISETIPASKSGEPLRPLHDLPQEASYLDFYAYSSEIVVNTLIRLSRAIKDETNRDKLSIQFYGYAFEVQGSCAGHHMMMKALASPDIDMFVSPTSYDNRTGGGISAFMTAVDSLPLQGKMWLVENDMRTDLLDMRCFSPAQKAEEVKRQTHSQAETLHCITRDFGALQTHRCGTWWMDLIAGNAFGDAVVWQKIAKLKQWFAEDGTLSRPYQPDVAVVIDEPSLRCLRFLKHRDQQGGLYENPVFSNTMYYGRHTMYRLGASVGYYYLEDFLNNKLPACKAYYFPCAWYLTDAQIALAHQRLDREEAMAIWQYAPAYLGPQGADCARASRLTGMQLARRDGILGSIGMRRLRGMSWGESLALSPRLILLDNENTTETLGRYADDGAVSAGWRFTGNHRSVFFGDISLSPEVLRPLLKEMGVHFWTENNAVVHTDGTYITVQTNQGGLQAIHLPPGATAHALERDVLHQVGNTLFVEFEANESISFKIVA